MKKFFACLFLLLACLILSLDLVLYHFKEISKEYMSEEKIYELISNISISDFLVDDNGEELAEIKKVKEELTRAGFPVETVDSILDTEKVEKEISKGIAKSLEIVLSGKEEEVLGTFSTEQILTFSKENIANISLELQKNNVPKSELLTEERQQEILNKMEEVAPQIEEQINKGIEVVQEKLQNSEKYQSLQEMRRKIEQVLNILKFLYSSSFNALLVAIAIGCILFILLLCHSTYRYLKFFGITSLLNASIFLSCTFAMSKVSIYTKEVPKVLQVFFENLFKGLENSFKNLFIIYLILFILLVIANIVIHKLVEGKVNKKIEEI